jgi:hypothetical protein
VEASGVSIEEFFDMMPHQVIFEPLVAQNLHAKASYGNAVVVEHARVVYENSKTVNDAGMDVIARGKIYLAGVFGITPKHRVTLPDGSHPPIIRVLQYPDEEGAFHETVLFA